MKDAVGLREQLTVHVPHTALVPTGDPGVSRAWRPRRWSRRRIARIIGYAVAIGATVAGVVLATANPTTAVAMSASAYRIGDGVLTSVGPGRYAGAGALVISPSQNGIVRSASDVVVGGRPETGVCFLSPAARQERCIFAVGATSVSSVDTWTEKGWDRRYDDGQRVSLTATTMVPVPFAVGR